MTNRKMELILELNQRYGYGYQAHLIMPPVDSILDVEPFTLYDAANGAKTVVDEINKATGSNYKLHEVLCITDEALRANKERDLASAKLWKEKRSDDHSSIAPSQEPMTRTMIIDGKEEVMLSARGLMLFSFYAWRDDRKPNGKQFLKEYCRLLATRKYGGTASEIFKALEAMSKDEGAAWMQHTFDQYMGDYDIVGLFQGLKAN